MNEKVFNPVDVAREFLSGPVGQEYKQTLSDRSWMVSVGFLEDFIEQLISNDVVFVKMSSLSRDQSTEAMPVQSREMVNEGYRSTVDPVIDNFAAERAAYEEKYVPKDNAPQRTFVPPEPRNTQSNIDLGSNKPKSVVERLRDMSPQNRSTSINPEE